MPCKPLGMLQRLKDILRLRALKRVYSKHKRLLVPLMLFVGVVIDFVTFRSGEPSAAFLGSGVFLRDSRDCSRNTGFAPCAQNAPTPWFEKL
jgi:hypothetical protein